MPEKIRYKSIPSRACAANRAANRAKIEESAKAAFCPKCHSLLFAGKCRRCGYGDSIIDFQKRIEDRDASKRKNKKKNGLLDPCKQCGSIGRKLNEDRLCESCENAIQYEGGKEDAKVESTNGRTI